MDYEEIDGGIAVNLDREIFSTESTQQPTNPVADPVANNMPTNMGQDNPQVLVNQRTNHNVDEAPPFDDVKPPPSPIKPSRISLNDTLNESFTCNICFDSFNTNGEHRLCCLACGHMFGRSCIERWLTQSKICPTCKKKAFRSHVRVLFCDKALRVVDNSEVEFAKQALANETQKRVHLEIENVELKGKLAAHRTELSVAQAQLLSLQEAQACSSRDHLLDPEPSTSTAVCDISGPTSNLPQRSSLSRNGGRRPNYREHSPELDVIPEPTPPVSLVLEHNTDIRLSDSTADHYRCLAYCKGSSMLAVAQPIASRNLFGLTDGVRKVHFTHPLPFSSDVLPIHRDVIRDAQFNPNDDGLILTVSVDRTAKISSIYTNAVIQTMTTPGQAWSCCWRSPETQYLFVALNNGRILMYDTRNIVDMGNELPQDNRNDGEGPGGGHVLEIPAGIARTPICRIQWIRSTRNNGDGSGLLVCHLNRVIFYEFTSPTEFTGHVLNVEGRFVTMASDEIATSKKFLVSLRPDEAHPRARHQLHELTYNSAFPSNIATAEPSYSSRRISTFDAGRSLKQMRRSYFGPLEPGSYEPTPRSYCAYYDEESNKVMVHNADTQLRAAALTMSDTGGVFDICSSEGNGGDRRFLNVLKPRVLSVYNVNVRR